MLFAGKKTMLILFEWVNWQPYFYTPLFLISTSQNTEWEINLEKVNVNVLSSSGFRKN